MKDIFDKCNGDGGYFGVARTDNDSYFTFPTLTPKPSNHMKFDGTTCIMWSVNNYLGLANHPEIQKVALDTVEHYGLSSPMGARIMSGTTQEHLDLETDIAEWQQTQAAYVFNYGYLGVLGIIASIAGPEDTIIMDKLSHSCIVDGAILSRANIRVFQHNNIKDLERILKQVSESSKNDAESNTPKSSSSKNKGGILIVTEGVFGMTGDLAPLPAIVELKNKYGARLLVDDAHGCGIYGTQGRGIGDHFGVAQDIDIYFSTFAKSFAAIGGFAVAEQRVIDWIKYNARSQVFAKSLPLVYVKALRKTLALVKHADVARKKLWQNSNKLKTDLKASGLYVGPGQSQIVSVFIATKDGTINALTKTVHSLREKHVFVTAVIYPVIPRDLLMLRVIPTALHTRNDINKTVDTFQQMFKELQYSKDMPSKDAERIKRVYSATLQ